MMLKRLSWMSQKKSSTVQGSSVAEQQEKNRVMPVDSEKGHSGRG
jgi:hypothetical protein